MINLSSLGWIRGSSKAFVQQKELAYQSSVEDLKTSVSEGKSLIAAAVTDKGVSTAADATFQTIATNIGRIKTSSIEKKTVIRTTGPYESPYLISMNFEYSPQFVIIKYPLGSNVIACDCFCVFQGDRLGNRLKSTGGSWTSSSTYYTELSGNQLSILSGTGAYLIGTFNVELTIYI